MKKIVSLIPILLITFFAKSQVVNYVSVTKNQTCTTLTTLNVPAVYLLAGTGGYCDAPFVLYTTSNSNDVLEIWGNRSSGITLGSIEVGEASILAVRIY